MKKNKQALRKICINNLLKSSNLRDLTCLNLIGSNNNGEDAEFTFRHLMHLFDNLEGDKDDKYILSLVYSIKIICFEYRMYKQDLIDYVKHLEEKYNNFLLETNRNSNDEILKELADIKIFIGENYSLDIENQSIKDNATNLEESDEINIDVSQYELIIEDLSSKLDAAKKELEKSKESKSIIKDKDKTIRKLNKQINNLSKEIESLTKKLQTTQSELDKLQKKISEAEKVKKEIDKKYQTEKKRNKSLNDNNISLQNQNMQLQHELEAANNYIESAEICDVESLKEQLQQQLEQIDTLSHQLSNLQQTITEQQNKENNQQLQEQRKNKLDDFLFKSLFKYKCTLDELIEYVSSNGLDYTKEEIIASLNRIRQIVAISDARKISYPRIYEISKPLYTTNSIFEIESNSECIDILLTSDWHITSDNLNMIKRMSDNIYNYCKKNNINLILNLGDFLDVSSNSSIQTYDEDMRLLEQIIKFLPKDDSITHAILGGNHDMHVFNVGVDPLEYLSNNRDDIYNLGYVISRLQFVNSQNLDTISLHHPYGQAIQTIDINDIDDTSNKINTYLTESKFNRGYLDSYINLFGHFHMPRIDVSNGYAMVPSIISNNRNIDSGVWHIKVYFDELKNIKYIDFICLTNNLQLNSETVYQKKK